MNTAAVPQHYVAAGQKIRLTLDGVVVVDAPLEYVIKINTRDKPLMAAVGLRVVSYLDPSSLASAMVLSQSHKLELGNQWLPMIKRLIASSQPWPADLARARLGDAPLHGEVRQPRLHARCGPGHPVAECIQPNPSPPTRNVHILVYFLVPYTTLASEC